MKKLLMILAIGLSSVVVAQKSNTTNAAMAYKAYEKAKFTGDYEQAAKDLNEAKEYIDQSAAHADTQKDPKTLMYLGMVYIEIPICAAMSGDETLSAVDSEEAVTKGFDALKESKAVDTKGRYHDDVDNYCNMYRTMFANGGIAMYDEEKYAEASGMLIGAGMFGEVMGISDSVYYFYGGIAAFKVDSFSMAEDAFTKTTEWGYQPGTSVYYLSQSLQKQDKMDEAETMLKEQVAKFPGDKDILVELVNLYIDTDRKQDAITFLNSAIELDPKNLVLVYTSGTIYENMDDFENAEKAYLNVLSQDASNVDALAAIGGLYYNKGAEDNNSANTLELGDPQYDALKQSSKDYFVKSVEYFEKANTAAPDDIAIMSSLKDAYGKAGMNEKYKEAKAKLEEMKAAQ